MINKIPNYFEAKELYLQGQSLTEIERLMGIDRKKMSQLLQQEGIVIRKNNQKHSYNESIFDVIDTEEKAYWLGFLYADGNTCNFGKWEVNISLAYKDKHHLQKLISLVSPTLQFREFNAKCFGKEYRSAKVQITNKRITESLIRQGCVPAKTLILQFPSESIVPRHLQRHFIRGYFDGDGNAYVSKDKRSVAFRIVGMPSFLEAIHDVFERDISGYTRTKNCKKRNQQAYCFNKGGRNVVRPIVDYLYHNATVWLERKYDKFLEMFE